MCSECKGRYDAVSEEWKDELDLQAREVANAILTGPKDLGVDMITLAAAVGIASRMLRAQMDEGTTGVVDAIAERGFAVVQTEYLARGIQLRPSKHEPLAILAGPPPQRGAGRPVRAAPEGRVRRIRPGWGRA
jgi:hypothetical protein